MATRPSLLIVTPTMPSPVGNGLAMRAGAWLESLAVDFDVTLLMVPLAGWASDVTPVYVADRCRRVVVAPLHDKVDAAYVLCASVQPVQERAAALASYPRPAACRFATRACVGVIADALAGERFDAILVLRSYLTPYVAPLLQQHEAQGRPIAILDLDDDETIGHVRQAALYERNGRHDEAKIESAEAEKYARHERDWLPCFDLLIVCTDEHAARLRADSRTQPVAIVPNTVAAPEGIARVPRGDPAHLLFLGNLSYWPNVDAALFLCREVWPQLCRRSGRALQLRIVGSRPAQEVGELARLPGVAVIHDVPEVASHYAWADVAVLPLRAGSGTRIKLLEAFAHQVPVVATRIGAEGICAGDGTHLLLADDPDAIAVACLRVLDRPALARRLAACAADLVMTRYSRAEGLRAIRATVASALEA